MLMFFLGAAAGAVLTAALFIIFNIKQRAGADIEKSDDADYSDFLRY